MTTYGFIGAGHMGGAIIGGLIQEGVSASDIIACAPDEARLQHLASTYGIHTSSDNLQACRQSVVVFAIKPDVMRAVCQFTGDALKKNNPLVISVAAGIRAAQIKDWLKYDATLVRAMPNTPALLGAGATGLYATDNTPQTQCTLAASLFAQLGYTTWVHDEAMMDTVTALSGSGPAYYFYIVECLIEGARQLGLPEEMAAPLAKQTILGAAQMLCQSEESPSTLRRQVTSPNGTTAAGLEIMTAQHIKEILFKTLSAATQRGVDLSQAWDYDE